MNPGKGNVKEIRMVCRSWIHERAQHKTAAGTIRSIITWVGKGKERETTFP